MPALDRSALATALADTEPEVTRWLDDPATTLQPYPAPFLARFAIGLVLYHTPYHVLGLYVAHAPGAPAYILSDEPQNFVAAALADPVNLETAEHAQAYATAYLETTRPSDELLYVVGSVDALRFVTIPNEAEQQHITALKQKYATVITPPAARRAGDAWQVTVFAVRQQALERHVLRVTPFGSIEMKSEILEGGLPVVFGHR
jgi:hypothetical protein